MMPSVAPTKRANLSTGTLWNQENEEVKGILSNPGSSRPAWAEDPVHERKSEWVKNERT